VVDGNLSGGCIFTVTSVLKQEGVDPSATLVFIYNATGCHKPLQFEHPLKKVRVLEDRMSRTEDNPLLTRNVFIVYNQAVYI